MKTAFKPGTLIYPLPAVMVTCGASKEEWNIITVAWTGTVCSDPPMCYVSIRPERHSHALIERTGEFAINLTTRSLARATDWCGVRSGRDYNKFREMGLHPEPAQLVKAPLIRESPLSIECKVCEVKNLGSHDMFIANVVAIDAEDSLIDHTTGQFHLNHAEPLAYSHGRYFTLGERLGGFGFSVKKNGRKGRN
ncbi:MAG: flavin reductase family protein [Bacteroidales bacterium]|nr:flavin reductase family protein [Bacteroidales bacterium]